MMFLPTIGTSFPNVLLQDLVHETQARQQPSVIERPLPTQEQPPKAASEGGAAGEDDVDSLAQKAADSLKISSPAAGDSGTPPSFPSVAWLLLGKPSEALVKQPGTPQLFNTSTHMQQQNSLAAIKAIVFRRDDGSAPLPFLSWGDGGGRSVEEITNAGVGGGGGGGGGGGYHNHRGRGGFSRGGRGGSFAGDAGNAMWKQQAAGGVGPDGANIGMRGGGGGGQPYPVVDSSGGYPYRGRGGYRGDNNNGYFNNNNQRGGGHGGGWGGHRGGGGGEEGSGMSSRGGFRGGSHQFHYQQSGGAGGHRGVDDGGAAPPLPSGNDGLQHVEWEREEAHMHSAQHAAKGGAVYNPYAQQGYGNHQSMQPPYVGQFVPQAQAMQYMQQQQQQQQEQWQAMMQQAGMQQMHAGQGQADGHRHPGMQQHQPQQMYNQYNMHPQAVYDMMQQQHFQQQHQHHQQQQQQQQQQTPHQQQTTPAQQQEQPKA
jgi:hypothetical protein